MQVQITSKKRYLHKCLSPVSVKTYFIDPMLCSCPMVIDPGHLLLVTYFTLDYFCSRYICQFLFIQYNILILISWSLSLFSFLFKIYSPKSLCDYAFLSSNVIFSRRPSMLHWLEEHFNSHPTHPLSLTKILSYILYYLFISTKNAFIYYFVMFV